MSTLITDDYVIYTVEKPMPLAIYVYLLIEITIVAAVDFKLKKIRNWWSVVHILLSLILFLTVSSYKLEWSFGIFPLAWFGVGYLLYLMKIMGAGDVKYISTLFLLIPIEHHGDVTTTMLYATILVGFILIILRLISKGKMLMRMLSIGDISIVNLLFGSKFSYAPVILITWIVWGWGKLSDFF